MQVHIDWLTEPISNVGNAYIVFKVQFYTAA